MIASASKPIVSEMLLLTYAQRLAQAPHNGDLEQDTETYKVILRDMLTHPSARPIIRPNSAHERDLITRIEALRRFPQHSPHEDGCLNDVEQAYNDALDDLLALLKSGSAHAEPRDEQFDAHATAQQIAGQTEEILRRIAALEASRGVSDETLRTVVRQSEPGKHKACCTCPECESKPEPHDEWPARDRLLKHFLALPEDTIIPPDEANALSIVEAIGAQTRAIREGAKALEKSLDIIAAVIEQHR